MWAVLIFPLALAIFWPRMTGKAFVASIVLGVGIGLPLRQTGHDLLSIAALEGVSLVVAVGVSLLERHRFDYTSLHQDAGELETVAAGQPVTVPAGVAAAVTEGKG